MNVHHKCQKKVANLCGINQKLMAEALATIESKQQVRKTNRLFMHRCLSRPVYAMFRKTVSDDIKSSETVDGACLSDSGLTFNL